MTDLKCHDLCKKRFAFLLCLWVPEEGDPELMIWSLGIIRKLYSFYLLSHHSCMTSTLKVTSKILQIKIWLTGSLHWKKREKGGQKGIHKFRYLQRDFSETPTMGVPSLASQLLLLCTEAWDMFSFKWINCYSCYIGILLVKNKRNNENWTANSQSLLLVIPLSFTFCESSAGVTKWWYPYSSNNKHTENQTRHDIPSLDKYRIWVLIHFGIVWFREYQPPLSSCGLKTSYGVVLSWLIFMVDLYTSNHGWRKIACEHNLAAVVRVSSMRSGLSPDFL